MKRQDIFDKVYKHLLNQGAKSLAKNGSCLYKSGGRKCAIGCLIDDKNYDSTKLEHKGISSTLVQDAVKNSNKGMHLNKITKDMLASLQAVHDNNDPENWQTVLHRLAKRYNLKIPT